MNKRVVGVVMVLLIVGLILAFLLYRFLAVGNPFVPASGTISTLTIEGEITELVDNGDGTYDVEVYYFVENASDVGVNNIQVFSDLSSSFLGYDFEVQFILGYHGFIPNQNYNGLSETEMLAGINSLGPWQSAAVLVRITVDTNGDPGPFSINANVVGIVDPSITSTSSRTSTATSSASSTASSATTTVGSGTTTPTSGSSQSGTSSQSSASSTSSVGASTGVSFSVSSSGTSTSSANSSSGSTSSTGGSSGSSSTASSTSSRDAGDTGGQQGGGSSSSQGNVGNAGSTSSSTASIPPIDYGGKGN